MNPEKDNPTFSDDARANEILEVIYAFAGIDFTKKVKISNKNDVLDGIATGVNMLGEELHYSTISLREKEQLLKEIHHRVKNNMQIVSSLLNLQSDKISDPVFLSLIHESKNRIYSMALVHEMLYKSSNFSHIKLQEYINRLVKNINASFYRQECIVNFDIVIPENTGLEIDIMIPVGLILNELISNSYKYAFSEIKNALISIHMTIKDGNFELLVKDNGKGFNDNFNEDSNSLGLQLIKMLSEQLNGKCKFSNENGAKFELKFSY